MKRSIISGLIIFSIVSLTVGCKTRKAAVVSPPEKVVAPPVKPVENVSNKRVETVKLLAGKDISYNTLSLKGKADLDINGDSHGVSINIRIKRDQKIWASVTAFAGIEAARVLLTPDSIFVLNKLQSTYLAKPFSYLQTYAGASINFSILQSILSGNTNAAFMADPARLELENGVWVSNGALNSVNFKLLFNTLLKSKELNVTDGRTGNKLNVIYDGYQHVDQSLFPSILNLNATNRGRKFNVGLTFSKIERNVTLDFPFSVPKRFELIK